MSFLGKIFKKKDSVAQISEQQDEEPMFIDMNDENLMDLLEDGKKKKGINFNRIPIKVYVIIIVFLFLLTFSGGLFLFLKISGWAGFKEQSREARRILVDNDFVAPNSLNYIYLDRPLYLGGGTIIDENQKDESDEVFYEDGKYINLVKLSLDNNASVFYFSENLDFSKYNVTLTDSFGNNCGLDLSYMIDGKFEFPQKSIRFEPLALGTTGFFLMFSDIESGEEFRYKFELTSMHSVIPSISFLNRISIPGSTNENYGGIYSMFFSSTASTIFFGFNDSSLYYPVNYVKGGSIGDPDITLLSRGKSYTPLRTEPIIYNLSRENSIVGRVDFMPIDSFTGSATLVFKNLYKEIPFVNTTDISGMFASNDEEDQIYYEVDKIGITYERILPVGDTFLFVYHGRDLNAGVNEKDKYFGRTEINLDCDLIITLFDGTKVILETSNKKSKDIGSNLIYDYSDSEHYTAIRNGKYSSLELVSRTLIISMGEVRVTFSLDTATARDSIIISALAEYFKKKNTDRDMYTMQVMALERLGSQTYAVIREFWIDRETGEYIVVDREIRGLVEQYDVRLDVDRVIDEFSGVIGEMYD